MDEFNYFKKSLLSIVFFLFPVTISLSQNTMLIHGKSDVIPISISTIDSVTFSSSDTIHNIFDYTKQITDLGKRIDRLEIVVDSLMLVSKTHDKTNTPPSEYNNVIRSIQRLGYGAPEQSIPSYKRAYEKGFRILLCDLIFTKDSVPVCFHDTYIGEWSWHVCYHDGTEVPKRPQEGDRVYIKDATYEELNQKFDFGISAGEEYIGTKLLKFQDMLSFCKRLGVELYIEVKEMDKKQAPIACRLVQQYGMENKVSWSGDSNMKYIVELLPMARVSTMPRDITDEAIAELNSFKTGANRVFFFGWNSTQLNEGIIKKLIDNGIEYEMGTIDTEDGVLEYMNQSDCYNYCTGIESNTIIAGKVLKENSIR